MGIIDEVKERLDIVEVVSSYVALKKAGRNYKGLCPFHTEKTPSFVVFPDTQNWHCFGACGTGGDMFAFVSRQEGVDFFGALSILAQRAGVELRPQTPAEKTELDLAHRLTDINRLAASFFHGVLLTSPAGQMARNYLERRGISQETIQRFQLGFAPDSWHALGDYLTGKGVGAGDLLQSGLVVAREEGGGHYDRFRARVMIPIRDQMGNPIGFGGRVLDDSVPKYLNTSETALFRKGQVLFGLDLAKSAIRAQDVAVVVEGYMDVIQAHQHGQTNVVAAMGTALTEEQVRALRKYARSIVLALDPDAAGGNATIRGLDLSRRITLHEVVKVGPALVESQRTSEADVRIAVLPEGLDPDDLIRESSERWTTLIQSALPVIEYYFQLMKGQFDLSTAQGKSQAAEQLLPVIRDLENPIEQAHYLQKLARIIQVDERTLQDQLRSQKRRRIGQEETWQTARDIRERRPPFEMEEHCLMTLLRQPDGLAAINGTFSGLGLSPLQSDDFSRAENRQLFETITHPDMIGVDSDGLRQRMNGPLGDHLDRLTDYWATLPPVSDETAAGEAVSGALKLRQQVIRRRLDELYTLCRDAETEGQAVEAQEYRDLIQAHSRGKNLVEQAIYARTLTSQRKTTRR